MLMLSLVERSMVDSKSETEEASRASHAVQSKFKTGLCVVCCIETCEKVLNLTVGGLDTMYQSARVRGENDLIAYLDATQSVQHVVHHSCRHRFSRRLTLNRMQSAEQAEENSIGGKRKLRSVDGGFNWKQKCVLCCDTCELGSSYMRRVQIDQTCNTIAAACDKRGDEWGLEVKGRLQSCNNLMAEEAIYHVVCHMRFCENVSKILRSVSLERK
jgi:hypothetical protein